MVYVSGLRIYTSFRKCRSGARARAAFLYFGKKQRYPYQAVNRTSDRRPHRKRIGRTAKFYIFCIENYSKAKIDDISTT